MRSSLKLLAVCWLLTSCAGALRGSDYAKGTGNPEETEKDAADCQMKAQAYAAGTGIAVYNKWYNAQFDPCMRSKGYKRVAPAQ